MNMTKLKPEEIIADLHRENELQIEKGFGPFTAAIYNENGECVSKASNTVLIDKNCLHHAEMNAIIKAQQYYDNYDLSSYNLSLYVTAEPCIMCLGGIMWSGIKNVYYSVPSSDVEKITGFDEGFKPNWFEEFRNRGIGVYPNILVEEGKKALEKYVSSNKVVYKPER